MQSEILPQTDKDRVIIQITDTHLMDKPDAEFVGINPEESFHAVMDDIQQRYKNIDLILHTGDLAQAAFPETYARYLEYMQRFGVDFYQIPGNHDNINLFPFHSPEPIPAVIELDQWRIILLNSAVGGRTDGNIQTEQLVHLKRLLEQLRDKFILIACHHNPFDMHSKWLDQHKLKNADELKVVLEPFDNIKAVLHGHVHQESYNVWNGIQFISTPATCVQFKPLSQEFSFDPIAPGYRCLHLKANGEFETAVHRLDHFKVTINEEISGY